MYYVYILASSKNGTLYIGVTGDLVRRVSEHRKHYCGGFTEKYKMYSLVYFESFDTIDAAIIREKRMKKWKREWKIQLIERYNSAWQDLYQDFV